MKKSYIRELALEYAYKWALKRNPKYYNYDNLGGDCTNFISQCIFAGSKVMNYTKTFGWYYNNANDKSPSWTGVDFLYKYLTRKEGIGPIGKIVNKEEIKLADIVQLAFEGDKFAHSLIVTKIENNRIYVSSHTLDNLNKPLENYNYSSIRFIHIEHVNL